MHVLRAVVKCALLSGVLAGTSIAQQSATSRISGPINEHQLVALKNTVSSLATRQNDRGAVADDMQLGRVHLLLQRSRAQESSLRSLIQEMNTPGSPNYHKWLTPAQFGKQFGPSDQDIAAVTNWLSSHGLSVTQVAPGKQMIEFTGTAGQFRGAFHSSIHQYQVNGEKRFANSSDPQIPAALSNVVGGFVSLNNFRVTPASHYIGKANYNLQSGQAAPGPGWTMGSSSTGFLFPVAPGDAYVQYDLNPLYAAGVNGTQQSIAVINESNINVAQVNQFRKMFGLPWNPPNVIIDGNDPGIDGSKDPFGPNFASTEAYLDVEWAGAIAPNANVNLVIAGDTTLEPGLLLAAEHAIYGNVAPVMSLSFETCEPGNSPSSLLTISDLWEQAAAQGISVLVASGDEGAAECDRGDIFAIYGATVNGLATSPWDTAVGGTDFYYSSYNQGSTAIKAQLGSYWNLTPSNSAPAVSIKGVIPEQPWNDSQFGLNLFPTPDGYPIVGGGGGVSSFFTWKPAWQSGTGVPADGARDIPDVSLFAGNGINGSFYPICVADGDCQTPTSGQEVQISGVGGTSVSVQLFAGMMALVNQQYGPQGQANVVLYPLAAQFPKSFNDVTAGTNSMPCDLSDATPDCIAVANPVVIDETTIGQIGSGTTPWYNATAGYDLATGLGTVDANQLVTNWNKVKFASSSVTMTPSRTSFAHGTDITLGGAVTVPKGIATGDVSLMTDSTTPVNLSEAFFTLDNTGAYTGSINYLPGGTYNIWAQYGGDTANAASSSAKTQITVAPETSDVLAYFTAGAGGLPPGALTVPYGAQVIVHARPVPDTFFKQCVVANPPAACKTAYFSPATGSIALNDGANAVSTSQLNSEGFAQYNAVFGVGTHSVTAAFAGDGSYKASTSAALNLTVTQNTPQLFAVVPAQTSPTTIQGGQTIVYQIFVANSANIPALNNRGALLLSPAMAPSGTVTVTGQPGAGSQTGTLVPELDPDVLFPEGVATFSLPANTPAGTYALTLTYSGDANYTSVTESAPITIVVPASGLASSITANLSGTLSPTSPGVTISGTVTGQTGNPAPTGTAWIYANGVVVAAPDLVIGASDSSSYSATLDSNMLPPGTNQVMVQYSGDTVYNPSATTLSASINNNHPDFTLLGASQVAVKAGSSGTATITFYSDRGFAGTLTLVCSPAPGVTCSVPGSVTLTAGGTATATLTINASANTANLNYNVGVTATDSTGAYAHTLGIVAQVSGSPAGSQSFFLSNSIQPMNVQAGTGSGNTGSITVYPLGRFSGTVNFSCAVTSSTSAGVLPLCTFTSNSLTLSGTNPQTTTVIINTQANGQASTKDGGRNLLWPTGGAALAIVLFAGIPKRRRNWLAMFCLALALVALGTMGCSHVSSGGPGNGPGGGSGSTGGTSAGSYTVTVTGTANNISNSTSFSLTVTQ
ncbi:MAG TPA: protease pro-enzyme activation domain-containing protein [Terracidiphilus sp.]|nr:protease pro-enzyme activation domain-containing protein [Terracidiphilus sp.]